MLLGSPPSKLLEFDGPAAWIFDLSLLGFLERRSGGGVAELVRRGRDRRLRPAQRRRLYIG